MTGQAKQTGKCSTLKAVKTASPTLKGFQCPGGTRRTDWNFHRRTICAFVMVAPSEKIPGNGVDASNDRLNRASLSPGGNR